VVLLTEELVPFPNMPASLMQDQVDYIVQVDSVGDPAKISVGAARVTSNPRELMIARYAADVIEHSGYFKRLLDADRLRRGGHRLHPLYGREDGAQRRESRFALGDHRQSGGSA
jgi:citrate lyase alpha subunit